MAGVTLVGATAPPERLAAFRVATGVFAVVYLVARLPVFVELREREPAAFDPVGALAPLSGPLPSGVVVGLIVVTLTAGVAYTVGWRFIVAGPIFAVGLLLLTTYRGSWGQLLHFENLMVLYVFVAALSPSADAWSLDARRRPPRERDPTAYGWPLALASLILVLTYLIAGVAKLRYGGVDWMFGDTLRNHVAYSAGRLELLGGRPSPVASGLVGHVRVFMPMAVAAVIIECAAPVALLGGWSRDAWVAAAWLMHAGTFVLMLVGFPYPLFFVAFAPLYRLERPVEFVRRPPVIAPAASVD
jgi:hypothetical protein